MEFEIVINGLLDFKGKIPLEIIIVLLIYLFVVFTLDIVKFFINRKDEKLKSEILPKSDYSYPMPRVKNPRPKGPPRKRPVPTPPPPRCPRGYQPRENNVKPIPPGDE